jgi:DNA-binding NtrC family response regulator
MAHILLIDDDSKIRTYLRIVLEGAGHRVDEAADGEKGLRAYQQAPADLVLCDILMPNKEGLETIMELRALHPQVPIIAMSGGLRMTGVSFLPLAMAFGAACVLNKPFNIETVLTLVQSCLEDPREAKSCYLRG